MPCSPSCPDERLTANVLHLLQGSNCEHNYDDCLLNPCPEGFSCIDGINDVSCLPPVLLETTVRSISHSLATREPLSGAELSAGRNEQNVENQDQNNLFKRIWALKWLLQVNTYRLVQSGKWFSEVLMLTLIRRSFSPYISSCWRLRGLRIHWQKSKSLEGFFFRRYIQ